MLADELDFVIGVDPHRDAHALAVVEARTGVVVSEGEIAACAAGYQAAVDLAEAVAPGRRAWAIEGTGSYGAGLARLLVARGERVLEVGRLPRERRSQAKTDALDAVRAARGVLGEARPALPRLGEWEGLRALSLARESALEAKKKALCQIRALIVTSPEPLRRELVGLTRTRLLRRLAATRPGRRVDEIEQGALVALRALARRVLALTDEERELERQIDALVKDHAPALLDQPGIGPICAAQILISWSHPGRLHNEAAFARLAGAAPIPASSGKTIRHRLDRGGDRKLNRALHTIIISRRKNDPTTIAYINRRLADGKTSREAIRCLKRYLARHLYRLLETAPTTT